ncbi:PEP-utilizing enzyme [Picosynechococcus sp. PCC 8807]|nr:PEP-utilizing enzyme [Picosynechococcus sp. PCC 8807]ANV89430.1 hypothetical protein AWQ24_01555 [Picosynechococcus sp. PCC 8807]
MTLTQVWGCLIIFTLIPTLGAVCILPWGDRHPPRQLLGDCLLGIIVVLFTRYFFPYQSPWELISLLAFMMGRYWRTQDLAFAAVWGGLLLHDWQITPIVSFIGLVGLTVFRQIRLGIWAVLTLIFVALTIRHGAVPGYWVAAIALGGLLGWLSQQTTNSRQVWQIFRPESGFLSLDQRLSSPQVGQDAATLSQLKYLGYPVLPGWVLKPGDDFKRLVDLLKPSGDRPYMVRLSSEKVLPRFQIPTEQLTSPEALEVALVNGFSQTAVGKQALLVQAQPTVQWSGITYSRPPLPYKRQDPLTEVVRDFITPLVIGEGQFLLYYGLDSPQPLGGKPYANHPPLDILQEVAHLSRQLEHQQGSPQALEWCFTGQDIWILRVRPIYHLHPVWTREEIASHFPKPLSPLSASLLEVTAPGAIASIYDALWEGRENLQNIALISHHRGYSYLNRSFWERVCRRENFEFSDLQSRLGCLLFGLRHPLFCYRYLRWDWQWYPEFQQEAERLCYPLLKTIKMISRNDLSTLSLADLVQNVEQITEMLELLLGYWLRGEVILWRRRLTTGLSHFLPPLPPKFQALNQLAVDIRGILRTTGEPRQGVVEPFTRAALFAQLAELPDGEHLFGRLNQWLKEHGDGADFPWELAQRRWREDSGTIRQQLTDLVNQPRTAISPLDLSSAQRQLQQIYRQQEAVRGLCETFLAQLRWHFLAIAQIWQNQGYLEQPQDIFWLKLPEVKALINAPQSQEFSRLQLKIQYRRSQMNLNQEQGLPPEIIYGQLTTKEDVSSSCFLQKLQGQAVSSGSVIGRVHRCLPGERVMSWSPNDILVTTYIDEHFLEHLKEVSGIITTQGGMLSQGASLARQHQIPMVANVAMALELLQPGQWVRLDGRLGQVELLDPEALSTDAN